MPHNLIRKRHKYSIHTAVVYQQHNSDWPTYLNEMRHKWKMND